MSVNKSSATRREFLRICLLGTASAVLAACTTQPNAPAPPIVSSSATAAPATATQAQIVLTLQPTPATPDHDNDTPTPAQTEGPYFKPQSPERASLLEPGMPGTRLLISGKVLGTTGNPIARALLDFWQANDAGQYDNAGYTLRGHQYTNDAGEYQLETIVPGLYPGRTRHIHVKGQEPSQSILTTQLYFPGEPHNAQDPIFNPVLLMELHNAADGDSKVAAFTFVLQRG